MQNLGKGGSLSPAHTVQAKAEEVHCAYYESRHGPMLRLSDALLQGPAVVYTAGSRFSEPNTRIRAPAPRAAVARRREEGDVGRSLIKYRVHARRGAGPVGRPGLGPRLRKRWGRSWWEGELGGASAKTGWWDG